MAITIQDLRAELCAVKEAISAVTTTGQSYSINGSHTVTLADLDNLRARESELIQLIAKCNGYTLARRKAPSFNAPRFN